MATNPVIITFCQLEDLFLSLKCDRFTVVTRQNIIDKLMQDFSISQEHQKRVENGVQAFLNYRSKLRQKKSGPGVSSQVFIDLSSAIAHDPTSANNGDAGGDENCDDHC